MKRFAAILAGLTLASSATAVGGEVTAVSITINGRNASFTATAIGNARSPVIVGTTRGGRAVANSSVRGRGRGFVDSRSVAIANPGLAISYSNADAIGVFDGSAFAHSERVAMTIGGVAVSSSRAISGGVCRDRAIGRPTSAALSPRGAAFSGSRAVRGGLLGGQATRVSDRFSNTFGRGRHAVSRVNTIRNAGRRAPACSDGMRAGIGVNTSSRFRHARPDSHTESRAYRSGRDHSRPGMIRVRR